MNKAVAGVIIAVVAVGSVAAVVINSNKKSTPPANTTTSQSSSADNMANMDMTPSTAASSSGESVAASSVAIQNYAFKPDKITVKVGTKVTWTNQDSVGHDITPDSPSDNFKASDLLDKGESYSFTFAKAGTYTYHCSPHPYMHGTVVVTQ